ncbi:MAG: hypothetical protein AAFW95_09350, partial [Cyanobacteria bacterium J06638_6]
MKLHPTLLATSSLLTLLGATSARADEAVLSFDLAEPQWAKEEMVTKAVAVMTPAPDLANQPLPIPTSAANPPMRYHSPQQLPAGVYRRAVAVALNETTSATTLLPPAPPTPTATVLVAAAPPPVPVPEPEPEEKTSPVPLELSFVVETSPAVTVAREAKAAALAAAMMPADPLLGLFEGNTNSLVAWAVGSAEGTRTPNGAFNPAYRGHTDPGNRVWNMGTFSYQHGAKTPEEADQKQLARLKNQGDVLRRRALKHGLNLSLEETLNGLDLANQSPLASIGRVGYIERLVEAKNNGYEGSEAILVARTRSYINPRTGQWNAPGLGNTEPKIRRDQKRRADAIAKAIAAYEAKDPDLQPQTWTLVPPKPDPASLIALAEPPEQPVEEVFKVWTSPSDPVATAEPGASELAATTPSEDAVALAASNDPFAALWQITTNTVTQLRSPAELSSDNSKEPQAAALFGDWPNGEQAPAPPSPEPDAPQPSAAEPAEEPQMAAFFGGWLNGEEDLDKTNTPSTQEASPSSPVAAAAPLEQQAVETSNGAAQEPAVIADSPEASAPSSPEALTPPTWAATREANQASAPEVAT